MSTSAARSERTEAGLSSEELARAIAASADSKGAADLVALGVGELVSYADYLVICTARNERLAKAIHDEVRLVIKREHDLIPAHEEGVAEGRWILCDYLDCVLHVMVPEARERYRLEQLWGEAPALDLELSG